SGGKQQCGETGSSVTEMKVSWRSVNERSMGNEGSERCPENELSFVCLQRRCNPESSDGCNAGRTGSAERTKPVVEVMIQSPQEAWNEKVSPQMVIRVQAGVRETLEERHRNED
ncbi:hypothetical protein XENOCAPTIV_006553, partial [Xenoophorus captivus]